MSTFLRTSLRCVVVSLLFVTLLTACGGLKGQLVGVWTDGQSQMEFKNDGTVNFNTLFGTTTGYWKEVDSTHIDLQLGGLAAFSNGRFEVRIEDDTLTMMAASGGGFSMKRFK
jgi:hypothetical protein